MGGINPAGDEFSKDGQSGCLIIIWFLIKFILGMIGSIICHINGYWSVCRWMWSRKKFSYSDDAGFLNRPYFGAVSFL